MSDFLNKLVARSFQPDALIRPRVASLFEPPSPAGGPVASPVDRVNSPENSTMAELDMETFDIENRSLQERQESNSKSDVTLHRRRLKVSSSNEAEEGASRVEDSDGPNVVRATEHKNMVQKHSLLGRQEADADSPESETSRSTIQPQAVRAVAVAETSKMPDARLTGERPVASTRTRLSEQTEASVKPESAARAHQPLSGNLLQPAFNHATLADISRHKEMKATEMARAATELGPSIHVTIGRVEVRAEIPSGPARRAERVSSPVQNLQEYLQQRRNRRGNQ